MVGTTVDLEHMLNPDQLAVDVANKWRSWHMLRAGKIQEWKELNRYLYATSTKDTSNALLPWSNTTTTPKLTQIFDNLMANYMASLFPQKRWMKWESSKYEASSKAKQTAIESYMYSKLTESKFRLEVKKLVRDYIEYGNCFAIVDYISDFMNKTDGEYVTGYTGPKCTRISPYDITFNPAASDFTSSPKIIKSVKTLGEIKRIIEKSPDSEFYQSVFSKMLSARGAVLGGETYDKADGFIADGFSSIQHYYESDYVEVLTFYGDIFNKDTKELMENQVISVVDRCYVMEQKQNDSWRMRPPIHHAGWRERPDNLYAMGPLDNLVGMQYRIDHLENLKADVFDQIAYPMIKVQGDVEDFNFGPGERIYIGEEGDVGYLVPDALALNADTQIQILEQKMEEMAGAPRQAMGIRTPGEKTAFEVQTLENSSSRIFKDKTEQFEEMFLEPILNDMLEVGRRKMMGSEEVGTIDPDTGVNVFTTVTKDDITGVGALYPIGARHFAEKARRVQSLAQLHQIKVGDPTVGAHLSGKEIARIFSEELGEPDIFGDNIAVQEALDTQQAGQNAEAVNQESLMVAEEEGF